MYKELTIKNIKTCEEEQKLKIAPLTLLYGENSSGKTTLLKTFDIVHNIFSESGSKSFAHIISKPAFLKPKSIPTAPANKDIILRGFFFMFRITNNFM